MNKQSKVWVVLTIVFFCTTVLFLVLLLQSPSMDDVKKIQAQNKELKALVELNQLINESESSTMSTTSQNKTYGVGEWWEVPGQWKLKIDKVYPTKERNSYSKDKPEEVVIIVYTYENLGYQDDSQDLFMTPDGVIDESKKMCETYSVSEGNRPQPTPPGAICEKATETYGLKAKSNTIKVMFQKYDNSSNLQKATFEVPVSR